MGGGSSLCLCVRQGSAVNKFYVHNDIFRYEEEVFGDSEVELAGKHIILVIQSWVCIHVKESYWSFFVFLLCCVS